MSLWHKVYRIKTDKRDYEFEGKTLKDAFYRNTDSRGNHPLVDDWIEGTVEFELSEEKDYERIEQLKWNCKNTTLILLLDRLGIGLLDESIVIPAKNQTLKRWFNNTDKDNDEKVINVNRKEFFTFLESKANTPEELESIQELRDEFEKDLHGKRIEDANEFAYEIFDMQEFVDCYEQTAEIIGYRNKETNEEIDAKDAELCLACHQPTNINLSKEERLSIVGFENAEGNFVCVNCGDCYDRNEAHAELNKHIPLSRLVLEALQ